MKLVFTPGSQEIELRYFTEHKKDKRFSGNYNIEVVEGSDFPEVPTIENFTSVTCINDRDVVIPLINDYSSIDSVNVDYDESTHIYSLNVVMV